jgi:Transposase IS116/IS110/IS902 family
MLEALMAPFRAVRDLIVSITGISTGVADVIIAETGADMTRFPTAAHLASWAGICPGNNESAGLVMHLPGYSGHACRPQWPLVDEGPPARSGLSWAKGWSVCIRVVAGRLRGRRPS